MTRLRFITAALALAVSLVLVSTPSVKADGTVQPGVYFFAPCGVTGGGCFNVTFASNLAFTNQIQWTSNDTLVIDGTTLQIDKRPNSYPALLLNFTTYTPSATASIVFDAIGTLATGTDIWINVSGLNANLWYQWSANGAVFNQQVGPSPSMHWWVFPFTTDIKLSISPGFALNPPPPVVQTVITVGVLVLVLFATAAMVLAVSRVRRRRRR